MTRVFISYSHRDEPQRAELDKHLSLLRRQGALDTWGDHRIPAGGELDASISEALESADVIMLLLSADFLASDYCFGVEMARAMERHDRGEAVVLPVMLHQEALPRRSSPRCQLFASRAPVTSRFPVNSPIRTGTTSLSRPTTISASTLRDRSRA